VITVHTDVPDKVDYTIEYFTMGHYTKFVPIGSFRIDSTANSNVLNSAFTTPDGSLVLIAYNNTTSSQSFKVVWNAQSFHYTLPINTSVTFRWQAVTTPAAPTGLTATVGNAQVRLKWNASTGATSYNIRRSTISGGPYSLVASNVTTASFTDTGLANGTTVFYVVSAVNTSGESANSSQVSATPVSGTLAINTGGPAVTPFIADKDFSGGQTSTHAVSISVSGVTNPAPSQVYQSMRFGNFSYTVPGFTAGSNHTVRLHFAETFWNAAGQRVFNVSINGTQVLTNFDILAAAGATHKAIVKQFVTMANAGGQIVIQFTTVTDNAAINGIEIQ